MGWLLKTEERDASSSTAILQPTEIETHPVYAERLTDPKLICNHPNVITIHLAFVLAAQYLK